jgi:hypothetical protein
MKNRIRRTTIGGQFAPRRIDMLRSPAYCVLTLSARRILDRIEIELADHGGSDNGKLPITYDDFERYGLHRRTIGPAIRELVALGFIEVTEAGRAGNAEHRKPNLFRLTYRASAGMRGDGTHEWMKISEEDAAHLARMARSPKTNSQWRFLPIPSGRNRHRKRPFHSAETATTAHSAETATTLDISGACAPHAPSLHDLPACDSPLRRRNGRGDGTRRANGTTHRDRVLS